MKTIKPFSTAFLQVLLVCANTVMIKEGNIIGIAICSLLISVFWTINVRSAMGDIYQRIAYCMGASTGGVVGYLLATYILT